MNRINPKATGPTEPTKANRNDRKRPDTRTNCEPRTTSTLVRSWLYSPCVLSIDLPLGCPITCQPGCGSRSEDDQSVMTLSGSPPVKYSPRVRVSTLSECRPNTNKQPKQHNQRDALWSTAIPFTAFSPAAQRGLDVWFQSTDLRAMLWLRWSRRTRRPSASRARPRPSSCCRSRSCAAW